MMSDTPKRHCLFGVSDIFLDIFLLKDVWELLGPGEVVEEEVADGCADHDGDEYEKDSCLGDAVWAQEFFVVDAL